jgi:ATP-binding cassette subfamily F protein uup
MKNRLLLSKVLSNPKSGLILDEPTNDLDTDTLDLVESILSQYNGTLIVVSHNRDFLDKLVNKILYFKGDGEVVVFNGGYHDFLSQKEQIISDNSNIAKKKLNVDVIQSKKIEKKRLTFKLKFELEKIPQEINILKDQLKELENIISDPSLFEKDNNLFIDTSTKIGSIQLKLQEKEDRWLQLMELDEI